MTDHIEVQYDNKIWYLEAVDFKWQEVRIRRTVKGRDQILGGVPLKAVKVVHGIMRMKVLEELSKNEK